MTHAFPQYTSEPNPNGGQPLIVWQEGMTLRDYFAAKAMLAYWLDPEIKDLQQHPDFVADYSYLMADAMMKARER
jgi:hypothetical protein